MQVQSIQSTNNNSFKANFINDQKGYFRKLWLDANIAGSLGDTVDKFYNSHKGHSLEIINVRNEGTWANEYTIFNHRNGHEKIVQLVTGASTRLEELIKQILESKNLFAENNKPSIMYQKLTGQKIDVIHKI